MAHIKKNQNTKRYRTTLVRNISIVGQLMPKRPAKKRKSSASVFFKDPVPLFALI